MAPKLEAHEPILFTGAPKTTLNRFRGYLQKDIAPRTRPKVAPRTRGGRVQNTVCGASVKEGQGKTGRVGDSKPERVSDSVGGLIIIIIFRNAKALSSFSLYVLLSVIPFVLLN